MCTFDCSLKFGLGLYFKLAYKRWLPFWHSRTSEGLGVCIQGMYIHMDALLGIEKLDNYVAIFRNKCFTGQDCG